MLEIAQGIKSTLCQNRRNIRINKFINSENHSPLNNAITNAHRPKTCVDFFPIDDASPTTSYESNGYLHFRPMAKKERKPTKWRIRQFLIKTHSSAKIIPLFFFYSVAFTRRGFCFLRLCPLSIGGPASWDVFVRFRLSLMATRCKVRTRTTTVPIGKTVFGHPRPGMFVHRHHLSVVIVSLMGLFAMGEVDFYQRDVLLIHSWFLLFFLSWFPLASLWNWPQRIQRMLGIWTCPFVQSSGKSARILECQS